MPKPYPREFREDVIRVARNREPGVRIKDVAADFGISESCLTNWLTSRRCRGRHQARHDRGGERGAARGEAPDPAARAGERGAAPSGGVSVAGEPAGKMMYPLVRELAADGIPVTVTCRVLKHRPPALLPLARRARSPTPSSTRRISPNAMFDAHRDDPEFGYRFLADEVRQAGHDVL